MLTRREFLGSCFLPLVQETKQQSKEEKGNGSSSNLLLHLSNENGLDLLPKGISFQADPQPYIPSSDAIHKIFLRNTVCKESIVLTYKKENEERTISFSSDQIWRLLQVFRSFSS